MPIGLVLRLFNGPGEFDANARRGCERRRELFHGAAKRFAETKGWQTVKWPEPLLWAMKGSSVSTSYSKAADGGPSANASDVGSRFGHSAA
jgi:hypothetical protein